MMIMKLTKNLSTKWTPTNWPRSTSNKFRKKKIRSHRRLLLIGTSGIEKELYFNLGYFFYKF